MSIHRKTGARLKCICYGNVIYLLITEVYHISVVITTINIRKGGVILYEKFARILAENNKTAYQVAKDTGIAQSTLSDWKTGRSNPKTEKLKILADYFGVPIEYFLETGGQQEEKEVV